MRMKKWFSSLGYRIQYFMQGRYGYDELCRFLSISALVLLLLSYIPYLGFFYFLALALLVWSCFRSFSKNIYKRQMERQKYLTIKNKVRRRLVVSAAGKPANFHRMVIICSRVILSSGPNNPFPYPATMSFF
jgi:flagellar biosynthesis component FlhA